jgi:hypothetical protein
VIFPLGTFCSFFPGDKWAFLMIAYDPEHAAAIIVDAIWIHDAIRSCS